ncbi:MAG TPA: molybdopterin-dependent oxidoreductase [Emcibacteraceae bacterium]|mgnify:CR=1 FL=1|nr:molybdopterin-dependent oxidoreductase [Emcibacteraceae bacterium]
MNIKSSRRDFLKGSLATGAMLVIGLNSDGVLAAGTADATLNPFVKISSDGSLTVILKHFEMGQGTSTGLTTLIAEELDVEWDKVQTEFAPADVSKYANLMMGMQGTGGSTSIANSYLQYRKAGAAARDSIRQGPVIEDARRQRLCRSGQNTRGSPLCKKDIQRVEVSYHRCFGQSH